MSDIAEELAKLHDLKGSEFVVQLKSITADQGFHPLVTDPEIFTMGGEQDADYENLIAAARKAVELGYTVYILPNPRGIRTADFIFVRKGIYRMYDLKTVQGKGSVGTQLMDSIGQCNRVLLNILSDYSGRLLASDIKTYFEKNGNAVEVFIMKGRKTISINRIIALSPMFNRLFRRLYEK